MSPPVSRLLRVDDFCEEKLCEGGVLWEEGRGWDGRPEHRHILRPGDGEAANIQIQT